MSQNAFCDSTVGLCTLYLSICIICAHQQNLLFQGMAVKPPRLVWTLTLEKCQFGCWWMTDSKWSAYLEKEAKKIINKIHTNEESEFLRPFAKLWLLISTSKELYDLRHTLMDVSYLICDAFGSWIILIDSAVQKLRWNIHQEAVFYWGNRQGRGVQ